MKHKIESSFKFIFAVGSPVLCLVLLFFACGRPPTQQVKVFVTKPKLPYAKIAQSVNVSFRLDAFSGTLLKEKVLLGENALILPKGKVKVLTGYIAEAKEENQNSKLVYSLVIQDVSINKETQSLEIYYPALQPIQYRKFGFVFKENTQKGLKPISVQSIVVQDPIAGTIIQNQKTGEELGFMTDTFGRASVDIPIFGQQKEIQLFVKTSEDDYGQIIWIPLETNSFGVEFYEVVLNTSKKIRPIDTSKMSFYDSSKTIDKLIQEGKSPRFKNVISSDNYSVALKNELTKLDKIDLLQPIVEMNGDVKPDNLFILSGREIKVKCKPHKGALYRDCPRITTAEDLKNFIQVESKQKVDFLLVDQDGYSIYTDKESTRDNPKVVTVTFP